MKKYRNMEFRELMVCLVNLFEPQVYVEVGVQKGYTFNTIAPMVKRAVAVDIKMAKSVIPAGPQGIGTVEKYEMTSEVFSNMWRDKIDLLFIDADHRKSAVLADLRNLSKFVRIGTGLILLHDTHPVNSRLLQDGYCSNAWEVAELVHSSGFFCDFEIVTLPGPWAGLSILRKVGKHHLQWMAEEG